MVGTHPRVVLADGGDVFPFLCTALAFADPLPVVAAGDGLVAAPPADTTSGDQTVGWLPVLADCLEERRPARFTVVDRAQAGETARSLQKRVSDLRELRPSWILLSLGSRELAADDVEPEALRAEVEAVVGGLRGKARKGRPSLILMGLVPPTLTQVDGLEPALQVLLDKRTADFNTQLAKIARDQDGVELVDLWTDWPKDAGARASLTIDGWSLSDQGHARVAAAVCDALLSGK